MLYTVEPSSKSGAKLRPDANTSRPPIKTITSGSKFYVDKKIVNSAGEGWWRLSDGRGWVRSSEIKIVDAEEGSIYHIKKTKNGGTPTPKNENKGYSSGGDEYLNPEAGYSGDSRPNKVKGSLAESDINRIAIPRVNGKAVNYFADYSFVEESLRKLKLNHNVLTNIKDVDNIRQQQLTRFNRYKISYPDTELTKSFGYVFITRPDLNLIKGKKLRAEIEKEPMYYMLWRRNPSILKGLTKAYTTEHDFLPVLCNRAISFEVQDEYIKSDEIGETFTGYKTKYGRNDIDSKTAGSISIQFQEDHDLNIYSTIKAWVTYISKVYRGEFEPNDQYAIRAKVLDYASSAYYFLCGEDGETIIFWTKYFGIIPTTTPSSVFSYSKGNHVKTPELSVSFEYASKEDFNPITFYEFNLNSNKNYKYRRAYEPLIGSTGKTMSGAPFIETYNKNGNYQFKLRFRP